VVVALEGGGAEQILFLVSEVGLSFTLERLPIILNQGFDLIIELVLKILEIFMLQQLRGCSSLRCIQQ
jgi:hypothetical protein